VSLDPAAVRWIADRCADVVLAAVDGDTETVVQAIAAVGVRHDDSGVYALCCGLAEGIARMGRFERRDGLWHGFEVFDLPTGAQLNSADLPADTQPMVKATQFLVAHLNKDTPQALALFGADPVRVSTGLAVLAGVHGRHRREQNENP
jgi:hypothetical protein